MALAQMLHANPKKPSFDIHQIKELVHVELNAVDELIHQKLKDNLPLIETVCQHLIAGNGKRIRPLLLLLVTKALAYTGERHIVLAALIELLHTATLLHDDVVDHSEHRRNRKTAHRIWNPETSILVGDFLHALSFQMMLNTCTSDMMSTIADATLDIVTGELIQLCQSQDLETTQSTYLDIVSKKTARLFAVAAQLAGMLCKQEARHIKALASYGLNLGMAYQLIDDVLDFSGDPNLLGKNIGEDVLKGNPTLPLIYAMHYGTQKQADIIRQALVKQHIDNLDEIIDTVKTTEALQKTQELAEQYHDKAIAALSHLSCIDDTMLTSLVTFIVHRTY